VAKVSVEATSLRDDSAMVDQLIREAIMKSSSVVEDLKQLEEGFHMASALIGQNIDRRIAEAEWLLQEVKNKTFEEYHNSSKLHLEEALVLLERINQFKEPSFANKEQINVTMNNVVNVIKLFSELMNRSQDALRTIVKAEEFNRQIQNRQLDQNINILKTNNEEVLSLINKANELLDETKKSLTSAETLIIDLVQMSKRLETDDKGLNNYMSKAQNEVTEVKPLVENAKSHAFSLKQQMDQLDKLFLDTRNKANEPLRAANAYNSIVESLENASKSAEETLISAQKAPSDTKIEEVAKNKERSTELKGEVQKLSRKIDNELENPLKKAIEIVNQIENQISTSTNNHTFIKGELDKSQSSLGAEASQVAEKAGIAAKKSDEEISKLALRIEEMKKNTENMSQVWNDVNSAVRQSQSYINHISTFSPDTNRIDKIKINYEKLKALRDGVGNKIADLKRKIDLARHQTNRIKLGAEFYPNSTLQLHNPDGFTKSATYTRLSLFFRTKDPNGLLAYIGNPVAVTQKTKQKRSGPDEDEDEDHKLALSRRIISFDYLSLELHSGNVVLNWDLGAGNSNPIVNTKYVYDGEWHQVIVERIGKSVTLTVRTQGEEDSVTEGSSLGPSSVFNLDQQNSRIFIGGIPDNVQVQSAIKYRRFIGSIEEVMLGDNPLGLWNYQESNNVFVAKEREALVNLTPSDGLRFDGSGYAILSRGRQNFAKETYVRLKFRTFAKEGLLFLIGHERDFLALEIREGKVVFKYELGSAPYVLTSNETYNDGQWHSINANRFEKEGALSVDGQLIVHGEAIGISTELSTSDDIYIGGFPKEHPFYEVTNLDFEGCIKELQIGTEQQNLNNHKEAIGVVPGCPITVSRTASFSNESTGYIAIDSNLNLDRNVQITLKFKTLNPRGLLFYVANNDHSSHLAIYLDEGTLTLRVQPGGVIRTEHRTYNDNQWHYITATFTPERLRLDVDDVNSFTIETTEKNELKFGSSKTIYFGGVSSEISSDSRFVRTIPTSFIGCFGDATVNEKFQNFADTNIRPNASLTSCPLADLENNGIENSEEEIKALTDSFKSTDKPVSIIDSTSPLPPLTSIAPEQPPPIGQCKLSPVPARDLTPSPENAIRFGDTHWSRHEFMISSEVANGLNDESGFQIEFKTTQDEGVIFYVTSSNHIDFVGLYLLEGKVHYSWDCGSGRAIIVSNSNYSDGQWHKVTFSRKGRNGILRIDDGREDYMGASAGNTNSLNVKSPIYIGGIPEQLSRSARNNLRGVDKTGPLLSFVVTSFPGCLRELSVHGNKYEFGVESVGYEVSKCTNNVEVGSFFHSSGGYIKLYDEFRVGSNFIVHMEIKPRTLSGVLLAVFGQTDYLIIHMNDGNLTFIVDNGAVSITSSESVQNERQKYLTFTFH
jgi:laminin alpha 3/5